MRILLHLFAVIWVSDNTPRAHVVADMYEMW